MTLAELTRHAAAVLPATAWGVRAAGDPERMVRTLAVSGGVGRQLPRPTRPPPAWTPTSPPTCATTRPASTSPPAARRCSTPPTGRPSGPGWTTLAAYLRDALGVETIVSDLDTDPWTVHAAAPAPPEDKESRHVKADPQAQRRLLDLQAIDTTLAQLAHRRATLPELAELEALARELSALEDERVRAQVAVDDLDRDIARLEKDVDQVRARKEQGRGPARRRQRPGPRAGGAPARAGLAQPPAGRPGGRRAGADGAAGDRPGGARRCRAAAGRGPGQARRRPSSRRDEALAEIAKEEEFKTGPPGSRSPPTSRPTWSPSTRRSARSSGGLGAALLTGGRCGGCRLDLSGARPGPDPGRRPGRGGALRGVPADHGPDRRVGPVSRWRRAGRHRGRRRLPGQPRTRRLRRGGPRRRTPARCWPSVPRRSASPPTTSPSTAG